MTLLVAAPGDRVRLNGAGLSLHRQLTQHGGQGIHFDRGFLSAAEALGTFVWLRDTGGAGRGHPFRGQRQRGRAVSRVVAAGVTSACVV
jgi:hypothetical protein